MRSTNSIVIYKAPHRIWPGIQITSLGFYDATGSWTIIETSVTVRFCKGCGAAVLRMDLPAFVTIVRRNWEIVSSFSIREKCTADYELDWDTASKIAFVIEDTGGLRITGQGVTLNEPVWRHCGECSDIDGSKVAEFSGLHAELQKSSFDFGTLYLNLLAKASYTLGPATLKTCLGARTGWWTRGRGSSFSTSRSLSSLQRILPF